MSWLACLTRPTYAGTGPLAPIIMPPAPPPPSYTIDDLVRHPFSRDSIFNFGRGADASLADCPLIASHPGGVQINHNPLNFACPVILGRSTDPVATITRAASSSVVSDLPAVDVRLPTTWPAYNFGVAAWETCILVQEDGTTWELYHFDYRSRTALIGWRRSIYSLGHSTEVGVRYGTSASLASVLAGALPHSILQTRGLDPATAIPFALHLGLPANAQNGHVAPFLLNRQAQLPACGTDGTAYTLNSATAPYRYGEAFTLALAFDYAAQLSALQSAATSLGFGSDTVAIEMASYILGSIYGHCCWAFDESPVITFRATGSMDTTTINRVKALLVAVMLPNLKQVTNANSLAYPSTAITATGVGVYTGTPGEVADPVGGGTPVAANTAFDAAAPPVVVLPGINRLLNSRLLGDTASAATNWSSRYPTEAGTIALTAAAVLNHRQVKLTAPLGNRSALQQVVQVVAGRRYHVSTYITPGAAIAATDPAAVILTHEPFTSGNVVGGAAARPTLGQAVGGARVSYAFDATVSGAITIVAGLTGAGEVTLERPMIEDSATLGGYAATDPASDDWAEMTALVATLGATAHFFSAEAAWLATTAAGGIAAGEGQQVGRIADRFDPTRAATGVDDAITKRPVRQAAGGVDMLYFAGPPQPGPPPVTSLDLPHVAWARGHGFAVLNADAGMGTGLQQNYAQLEFLRLVKEDNVARIAVRTYGSQYLGLAGGAPAGTRLIEFTWDAATATVRIRRDGAAWQVMTGVASMANAASLIGRNSFQATAYGAGRFLFHKLALVSAILTDTQAAAWRREVLAGSGVSDDYDFAVPEPPGTVGGTPLPTTGRTPINVTNQGELTAAIGAAVAGQDIIIADGSYSFAAITRSGTQAAPIVIRAQNLMGVVATSNIAIDAADVILYGIDLPNRLVTVGGSAAAARCKVWRCRFRDRTVTPSQQIALYGINSPGLDIAYCNFERWAGRGISLKINAGAVGVTVRRNLFKKSIAQRNPTTGQQYNGTEAIQCGQAPVDNRFNSGIVIEYNLISEWSEDDEGISIKASGVTCRWNTLLNSTAAIVNRHGRNNRIEGNRSIGSRGFELHDGEDETGARPVGQREPNLLLGNIVTGGGQIRMQAGNYVAGTLDATNGTIYYPRCSAPQISGNSSALRANAYGGNTLPVRAPRIRQHTGTIDLSGPVTGADSQPGVAETLYTWTTAPELTEADVGING